MTLILVVKLKVGTGIVPAIKEGDERINGSMYAEGPVVFGGPTEFDQNRHFDGWQNKK